MAAEQLDNVVFMKTWKLKKEAEKQFTPYKNRYFLMSPDEQEEERRKVHNALALNPLNYMANLMQRAQAEVDNG